MSKKAPGGAFREVIFTSEYVALSEKIDLVSLLPSSSRTDVISKRQRKISSFGKQTYSFGDMYVP